MGFLLVQHELFRAKAKVNALTLKQTQLTSRKDRITKAIEKKEKLFNKEATALERKYTNLKSGLTNAINVGNWSAVASTMKLPTDVQSIFGEMYANLTGNSYTDKKTLGVEDANEAGKYTWTNPQGNVETVDENFVNQLKLHAYQQQQSSLAQLKAFYQTLADQFLESAKEMAQQELEDRKELAMLPLNEQDTEIDIETKTNDAQLASAEELAKSLEGKLGERVKDANPKFGLG